MNKLTHNNEPHSLLTCIENKGTLQKLTSLFAQLFSKESPSSRLVIMVSELAMQIGLSRKQRIGLQKQAKSLAHILKINTQQELSEPMLISALQGNISTAQALVLSFNSAASNQRSSLLTTLSHLSTWFKKLNQQQQQKIKTLQQRPFRLAMG